MKNLFNSFLIMLLFVAFSAFQGTTNNQTFIGKTGYVKFVSEAPLERIEAENKSVGAVLDVAKKSVAFKVPVNLFNGFNSALQQEHFQENYLETEDYPTATFTGKIIEDIDFTKAGTYKVRAKGMLSIHGADKERIINGTIKVAGDIITVSSNFEVPLADHEITVPKIVNQKIAEVINVEIKSDVKRQ